MALKFEKLHPGMVIYSRGRERMGNTKMKTITQYASVVVAVDAEMRRVTVRFHGIEHSISEARLSRYFDWSMFDPAKAVIETNTCGAITKVRRISGKKV